MEERQPPRFTGVRMYNDPKGRFSLRHPTTWAQSDLDEDREGVMWIPNVEDLDTNLSIWVSKLEMPVVAEDKDDLQEGVKQGLASLQGVEMEKEDVITLGDLVKFELIYTYRQGERTLKRKGWILYVSEWMIVFTWQGSSVEEYEYWLAMANYSFATFNIPEELWFATDRDREMLARMTT